MSEQIVSIDLTHLVEAALRGDVASAPPVVLADQADEDDARGEP